MTRSTPAARRPRRAPTGTTILALLVALGSAGAAGATPAPAADAPAVLVVGVPDDLHEAAVAAELQRMGASADEASRWATMRGFVFHDAELWPRDAVARACPAGHPEIPLETLLLEAHAAVDSWDYPLADDTLEVLLRDVACIAAPLNGPDLARAALLLGYARFEDGDLDGAREAFRAAAAFDGGVGWDPELPPDAEKLFDDAVAEELARAPARLDIDNRTRIRGVRVDGTIPPASNELSPGIHQLVVPGRDGAGVPLTIDLAPGASVDLAPVDDLVRRLLNSRKGGGAAAYAVVEALAPTGRVDVLIADLAAGRLLRFDGASGAVVEAPPAASRLGGTDGRAVSSLGAASRSRRDAALALIAGGGAAALAGFVVDGATYQEGLRATDQARYESLRSAGIAGIVVGVAGIAAGATGAVLLLTRGRATVAVIPGPVPAISVSF